MEAHEVHEFTEQVKEGGEASLTRISLAISILAVLVAIVTVLGHREHTEAVLSQGRASDQWNEYQAKKIRSENTSIAIDTLELEPAADARKSAAKLEEYRAHVDKWKEDLAHSQEAAREFEQEVGRAEARASRFDLGEALLQISVVLCSITLFTRRQHYFLFGLLLGLGGLVVAASAFLH